MHLLTGDIDEVISLVQVVNDFIYVSIKSDAPLNAVSRNGHLEIVKYLVENGARTDLVEAYGNTTRMAALEGGQTEILEYFDAFSVPS